MDDFDKKDEVSVYNESALQLQRLHYIWIRCANLARNGDLMAWRWELDVLTRELVFDIYKQDGIKAIYDFESGETMKKLAEFDSKIGRSLVLGRKGDAYRLLQQKEMILRLVLNKSGKGAKYKSRDEDSFED